LNPVMAALLGMLTGIGGGIVRDVLLVQIASVLRAELYAVAALAGAGIVVANQMLHLPALLGTIGGIGVCVSLRLLSIRRGWRLPVASPTENLD